MKQEDNEGCGAGVLCYIVLAIMILHYLLHVWP